MLSRRTDAITGKDVVESIKAGTGTICRVHQPKHHGSRIDPAQKVALDATRLKLGFNSIDHNHKRKLDDFLAENEDEESGCEDEGSKCTESEDDEESSESKDDE